MVEVVVAVEDLEVVEVDMVVAVEVVHMVVAIPMAEGTTIQVQVMVVRVVVAMEEVVMVAVKEVVAPMVNIIIKVAVGIILNNLLDNIVAVVMVLLNLLEVTASPQVDKVMVVNHLLEVKVSNIVVVIASQLHQPVMALVLMDNKHQLLLRVTIRAMVKVLEDMVVLRLLQEDIQGPVMVLQQELVMEEAVEELVVMVNKQVSCIARSMPLLF